MNRQQETVASLGGSFSSKIERVVVNVSTGLGSNEIPVHRFRGRPCSASSSFRCRSAQYSGPASIGSPDRRPSIARFSKASSLARSSLSVRSTYASIVIPSASARARRRGSSSGGIRILATLHLGSFYPCRRKRRFSTGSRPSFASLDNRLGLVGHARRRGVSPPGPRSTGATTRARGPRMQAAFGCDRPVQARNAWIGPSTLADLMRQRERLQIRGVVLGLA